MSFLRPVPSVSNNSEANDAANVTGASHGLHATRRQNPTSLEIAPRVAKPAGGSAAPCPTRRAAGTGAARRILCGAPSRSSVPTAHVDTEGPILIAAGEDYVETDTSDVPSNGRRPDPPSFVARAALSSPTEGCDLAGQPSRRGLRDRAQQRGSSALITTARRVTHFQGPSQLSRVPVLSRRG